MANEKRLIDANAIKRHMIKAMEISGVTSITQEDFAYCIDHSDTVDAVEVVRCKDCAYAMPDGYVCFGNGEMMPPHPTYPDRHCSCGERRTDND